MMIKYIVIGYGWRADFYMQAARKMPDRFCVTARVVRTESRAKELSCKGENATTDLNEALKSECDFAVLCVPRSEVNYDFCSSRLSCNESGSKVFGYRI